MNNEEKLETIFKILNKKNGDLKELNLNEMNFSEIVFENFDFSNTKISNCNFSKCNFINCVFIETKIESSDFSYSNFINSKINAVKIHDLKAQCIQFNTSKIINSEIKFSNFLNSEFIDTDFYVVDLYSCLFSNSYFSENSKIENSKFDSSYLGYCDIRSNFTKTLFSRINFENSKFFWKIEKCNFTSCFNMRDQKYYAKQFQRLKNGNLVCYKIFDLFYPKNKNWKIENGSFIEENLDYDRLKGCSYGINATSKPSLLNKHSGIIYKLEILPEDQFDIIFPNEMMDNADLRAARMKIIEPISDSNGKYTPKFKLEYCKYLVKKLNKLKTYYNISKEIGEWFQFSVLRYLRYNIDLGLEIKENFILIPNCKEKIKLSKLLINYDKRVNNPN